MTFIWFMVSLNCSSWCADDSASSLMSVSFISFSCSCCCNSNTDSSWLTGRRTNLQHSFITAWRTPGGATYSLETSLVSRTWEASECRYKFISADLMLTYFNSPVFISTDLSKCINVHNVTDALRMHFDDDDDEKIQMQLIKSQTKHKAFLIL